jgi:hypothetical protein
VNEEAIARVGLQRQKKKKDKKMDVMDTAQFLGVSWE